MKKILVLLIVSVCAATSLSADVEFVFGGIDQHSEVLGGFLPTYASLGAGFNGLSLIDGHTTQLDLLVGGGYSQRKVWQDPQTGEVIRTNPLIWDTVRLDWTVRLSQGFFDSTVDGKDLVTLSVGYTGRYDRNIDSFRTGSVRDNICLTKRNATLEEIIYAARLAGAHDFVQNLPRGYDTILEENASNLSGGQKQRLAIARALLTNPPVLIFDEATSALDPESENVIQENLGAISKGRTVLIISHRLSIVSGADRILVLDKGVKTDFAPHRELLTHEGIYRDFWRQQMERNLNK